MNKLTILLFTAAISFNAFANNNSVEVFIQAGEIDSGDVSPEVDGFSIAYEHTFDKFISRFSYDLFSGEGNLYSNKVDLDLSIFELSIGYPVIEYKKHTVLVWGGFQNWRSEFEINNTNWNEDDNGAGIKIQYSYQLIDSLEIKFEAGKVFMEEDINIFDVFLSYQIKDRFYILAGYESQDDLTTYKIGLKYSF